MIQGTTSDAGKTTLVAGLASCSSSGGPRPDPGPSPDVSPIRLERSAELDEIAQLEYARSLGDGRLVQFLDHPDPRLRDRATLALGRFPFPDFGEEVTGPLSRALEDPDPQVRQTAAFAIGQRRDPLGGGLLAPYMNSVEPAFRMRIAEASRHLDVAELRVEVTRAMGDDDLQVRIAAVLASAMWDTEAGDAGNVDRALLNALEPVDPGSFGGLDRATPGDLGAEVPAELRWRVLYALARRRSEAGRGAFLQYSDSTLPLERLFAVKGLANIEAEPASTAVLAEAVEDPDWRTACEAALGLGRHLDPTSLAALGGAMDNSSPHVRRCVVEALGEFPRDDESLRRLMRGMRDVSATVRASSVVSLARVLEGDEAADQVKRFLRDQDPVVRAGAAMAARHLDGPDALAILTDLVEDTDVRVAGTAVESLGPILAGGETGARDLLHAATASDDNGIRLWAVLALSEAPDTSDVPHLTHAVRTSTGDIAPEIAFNSLRVLGEIGGEEAKSEVRAALAHADSHVRRVARDVLEESWGVAPSPTAVPAGSGADEAPAVPLPGRDFPLWTRNPLVEVRTSRGTMLFELFPEEAPVHVHNFLQLVQDDHYDGLFFHRVVPDFVIQGGDARGDGNGGAPWNGRSIPQEFTTRRTIRGSLGMPRNEDPDSGGSQIFVTHRPTPHLDGRYTIFGEMRAGGDVLDRIEVGDRILDVRLAR